MSVNASSPFLRLVCDAYREAAKTPSLVSAMVDSSVLSSGLLALSSRWSQTNLSTNTKVTFTKQTMLDSQLSLVHETGAVPEAGVEMMTVKDDLTVKVRAASGKEDCQNIEVWSRDKGLVSTFNMKEVDKHGKIYTDGEFGSLQLSQDKKFLYYIAEKKKEKNSAFLSQSDRTEDTAVGGEYQYSQDWGEQMVAKVTPVVVKLGLEREQPVECEVMTAGGDYSPGLVRPWAGGLVGVGYNTQPRKLGKVYCSNRPASLFYIPLWGGDWRIIRGGSELGITEVSVSPQGKLVWLERSLTGPLYPGPHQAALRLMCLDSPEATPREVVSHLQPEFSETPGQPFCGLFSPHCSPRCWLGDNTLVLSGAQGETMVPIFINIDSSEVTIPSSASCHGVEVLDVAGDLILGKRSDPLTPPHLVLARLTDSVADLQFSPAGKVAECPVPGLTWSTQNFRPDNIFTAHYIGPRSGDLVPLIVWPHGGPHSIITTDFKNVVMFFCQLGYGVLFVNYRGSIGFSEENVRSLLGHVGDNDVKDCHMAKESFLSSCPWLSRDKVLLMGGSHGGFLVTHLAGQYPDDFKGVVARNPVTNIASMAGISDIPDWTWNESGVNYDWKEPSSETYDVMYNMSPIKHIDHVKAPIYLMIGKNDLRVPPSQGIEYYHALKARGKSVKMNMYDDNHPLGKVENDVNVMINAALFFKECIDH